MKAIIYAGIGLFSAASVYGVVDYLATEKKGKLKNLYQDKPEVVETITTAPEIKTTGNEKKERAAITTAEKKKVIRKKKKAITKTISLDDFSRARIPEEYITEEVKPVALSEVKVLIKNEEVKPVAEITVENVKPAKTKAAKPERRIRLDMFSRAPLKSKSIVKETKQ